MRFFLVKKAGAGVVLCAGMIAWAQNAGEQQHLAPADVQILAQTAKQAAYAFSLGTWCTSKNRNGLQQYAAAVAAWQQRNHWRTLEDGPMKTELAPGEYDGLKAEALKEFNAHNFKTVFLCAGMANVLRQPEHDPSQKYGADLSRIAASSAPAAAASAKTETPANAVPPAGEAQAPPVQNAPPAAQSSPAPTAQGAPAVAQGMAVAASGPVKVGDASLASVAGWAVTKSAPDQVILQKTMREKDTRDAKLLVVLSMQPMQGSIDQAFPAAVRRSFPGPPLELKYVHKGVTRGGQEARTVRDGGRLNLPGNPRARVRAVGMVAPDGRLLLAMILMRSDWESLMSKADDEFEAMVASLHFASQPESALWDFNRPKGASGQSGLYWSNRLQNTINPLGGMDLRAIRDYVVLLPSGQAYRDLPKDGHVLDIDFASACKAKPKNCGTYEIQGGTIRLRWLGEYGLLEEESGAWTPSGKGGFDAGAHYTRITPVHDLRMNGKYTSTFAMVGNMATQSTSVVSEKYLTLTTDGRYQKSGFSAASFDNSNAAGTFGGRKPVQSGTYSMNDYTLTLTPSGGAPELYTLVLEDPTPNATALFIDDDAFLKKDGR